ncbi:MAG: TIGR01440 family protein [Clostridia bacterium]|nr:TIGR01440 family protein [Clostridia bacterium]
MTVKEQASLAAFQLVEAAKLNKGDLVIVGCSTSEVVGSKIGTDSQPQVAKELFDGIYEVLNGKGIYLAAQCCEHLNRAVIVEAEAVKGCDIVNVVPQPKAGGSFATAAYAAFEHPVAVEEIKADAGLDIGGTLIGMHLKKVAVPLRLEIKKIGEASLAAARTRPKFIGGARAQYDENLL